jgi:hypothetical protein
MSIVLLAAGIVLARILHVAIFGDLVVTHPPNASEQDGRCPR